MSPPTPPAEATAGAVHGPRPAWFAMAAPLLVLAFLIGHEWPGSPLHAVPFLFAGLIAGAVIPALLGHLGIGLVTSGLVAGYGLFELYYCSTPIPPFATGRDLGLSSALLVAVVTAVGSRARHRRWMISHATRTRTAEANQRAALEATLAERDAHLARLTARLNDNEVRYRAVLNSAPDAVLVLDTERGLIVDANRRAAELFGFNPADTATPLAALSPAHQPDGRDSAEAADARIREALDGGRPRFEWWHLDGTRRTFPCEVTLTRLTDERRLVRGDLRPIAHLLRERQLKAAEGSALRTLTTAPGLGVALEALCARVESVIPDSAACVLRLDPVTRRIRDGTCPSMPAEFGRRFNGQPVGPMAGSCGTAMWRDEPVIVTDIETDPLWQTSRDIVLAEGLRACWSVPVRGSGGRVLGSFTLYNRVGRAPDDQELGLLHRAGDLASIAIQRHELERTLERRDAVLRSAAEHAGLGVGVLTADGHWLHVDAGLAARLGTTASGLSGRRLTEIVHPEDRPAIGAALRRITRGENGRRTLTVRRPEGAGGRRLHLTPLPTVDGRDQVLCLIDDDPTAP